MRLIITFVILACCGVVAYVLYTAIHPYILNLEYVWAVGLEKKDPEAADAAYRKLIEDLKNSPDGLDAPNAALCNIYQKYGDFLFDNGHYPEALSIFKDGENWSKKIRSKSNYESTFLMRQSFDEHYLFQDGKGRPADPAKISQAMKLRLNEMDKPCIFRGSCFRNLALSYMDSENYTKADQYFQKAIADYEAAKDEDKDSPDYVLDNVLYRIENLIKQKRFAEANNLYIEALSTTREDRKCRLTIEYFKYLRFTSPQLKEIFAHARKSLADRNFADLDAYAEKLISEATITPSGHWTVDLYFEGLNSLEPQEFKPVWEKRIDTLKDWQKANPQSAAAPVALANCLTSYAWKARGTGWADSVTEEGWRLFRDRLQQASEVLTQTKRKIPCWYRADQVVALGQGWDRSKYDALVEECRKQYPTYYTPIYSKAYFILPKWHGDEGEVGKYAAQEASAVTGADGGDVLYARIAWSLVNNTPPVLKSNMSWPRIKSGFQTLKKRFPTSALASGVYSAIAMEFGDKATAQNAFK
jgi:tetratricopeptide (TPR) repeat protein